MVVVMEVVGGTTDKALIWFAPFRNSGVAEDVVGTGATLLGTGDVETVMQDTVVVVNVTSA
jgi:hypothetical protein